MEVPLHAPEDAVAVQPHELAVGLPDAVAPPHVPEAGLPAVPEQFPLRAADSSDALPRADAPEPHSSDALPRADAPEPHSSDVPEADLPAVPEWFPLRAADSSDALPRADAPELHSSDVPEAG